MGPSHPSRSQRALVSVLLSCAVLASACSSSSGKRSGTDSGAPDGRDAGPDTGRLDRRDAAADGGGSDASKTVPDGGAADALKAKLDGNATEVPKLSSDGPALDAADGARNDVADAAPDRRADAAVLDPDGGTQKDEIVRACAKAASCASAANVYSASQCIQDLGRTASRSDDIKPNHLLACASAPGPFCSGFIGCWGGNLFTLRPFVENGQCDGNSIEVTPAGASAPQYLNCGTTGGVCEGLATGVVSAACNARSCSGAQPPEPSCDGATASGCGGWLEYTSLDCARSGRTCRIAGKQAICAGTGTACSESDRVKCAGSVATYCSGGALATVDCAKTGTATRCAAGAPATEPCTAAGTECNPASFVEYCDGNSLMVCADGELVAVACNTIGLVLCFDSAVGPAQCMPGT